MVPVKWHHFIGNCRPRQMAMFEPQRAGTPNWSPLSTRRRRYGLSAAPAGAHSALTFGVRHYRANGTSGRRCGASDEAPSTRRRAARRLIRSSVRAPTKDAHRSDSVRHLPLDTRVRGL